MATAQYLVWRVGSMLVTVLIGAVAVFFAMKAAPGDPALAALGESASSEAIAAFTSGAAYAEGAEATRGVLGLQPNDTIRD